MDDERFSVLDAKRIIDEEGYLQLKGSGVGDRVANFERSGFHFWTEDGLNFCKRNILFEKVRTAD